MAAAFPCSVSERDWDDEITETEAPDWSGGGGQPSLVALTGVNAGEAYLLRADSTVVGRAPSCDLRLLGPGVSRRHCTIQRTASGAMVLEDLGSTNGVIVNGERVSRALLREGDRIFFGRNAFRFSLLDSLEESYQRRLYESALRDDLTGAYNKRYFRDHLELELQFALRHETDLAVILVDLDGLKRINDQHGHAAGDRLLAGYAVVAREAVREHDIFARLGGDEFAVCARAIDHRAARALANRLVDCAGQLRLPFEGTILIGRASAGIASVPEITVESVSELLGAADRALYRAKRSGGGRVEVAEDMWAGEATENR